MNSVAQRLRQHLESEGEAYNLLNEVLTDEQQALVNWSIADLKEIEERKEDILEKIQKLERRRYRFLQSVQGNLHQMGLPVSEGQETIRLSDIIVLLDQQEARALKDLQEELAVTVKNVTTANHKNQVLLKRSLEIVNANLNIYAQSEKLAKTYNANGQMKTKREKHLVDGSV